MLKAEIIRKKKILQNEKVTKVKKLMVSVGTRDPHSHNESMGGESFQREKGNIVVSY